MLALECLFKRDIWKFATKQLWMQSAGWGPQVFLLVAQGKCSTCTSGSEGKKQVLCRKYWSEQSTLPCSFGEHEIEWDEVEHHRCLCKIPRAGMDARLNWKVLGVLGRVWTVSTDLIDALSQKRFVLKCGLLVNVKAFLEESRIGSQEQTWASCA